MNNIETLRSQLFKTLESLNDRDNPMEVERARAVAEISQVIINSAKVEVDYLRVVGGDGTGFITEKNSPLPSGITGITKHRIQG